MTLNRKISQDIDLALALLKDVGLEHIPMCIHVAKVPDTYGPADIAVECLLEYAKGLTLPKGDDKEAWVNAQVTEITLAWIEMTSTVQPDVEKTSELHTATITDILHQFELGDRI